MAYERLRKQWYAHYDVSVSEGKVPVTFMQQVDNHVCKVTGGATWLEAKANPWQIDMDAAHSDVYSTIGYESHGVQLQVKCEDEKFDAMLDAIEQGFKAAAKEHAYLDITWVCGGIHQVMAHNINVKE
jgi:hypothetical protein